MALARTALMATLALTLLAGCRKEEITVYEVPREKPAVRLLGAIVPHGDSTWFFKLVGPVDDVAARKDVFEAFVRSVKYPDKPEGSLAWQLPPGWKEDKGPPQRYATLRIAGTEPPLELTVTRLGREGQAASIAANVNRWRRNDLGLNATLPEEDLPRVTRGEKVGDTEVTFVDASGPGSSKKAPGMGGKAGMGPMPPMPGAQPGPARPLARPVTPPAGAEGVRYDTPPGWQSLGQDSGFVKAAFRVTEGSQTGRVTISTALGTVPANVNRWRDQLKLPALSDAEVLKTLEPITVGDIRGSFVDLTAPAAGAVGAPRDRILGAIVPRGGSNWFFKMQGPADLVEKQKTAFRQFLTSIQFDGGK